MEQRPTYRALLHALDITLGHIMSIMNRAVKLLSAVLLVASLSGCGLLAVEGGYAEPCEINNEAGWTKTSVNSLQKYVGKYRIDLGMSHFSRTQEPGLSLFIRASSYPTDTGKPKILFNPSTAFVEIHGQKVPAQISLRESPFSKAYWRCGGDMPIPADLNSCGSAALTFDTRETITDGFLFHVGTIEIDGVRHEVPDVKFCYVRKSFEWQRISI